MFYVVCAETVALSSGDRSTLRSVSLHNRNLTSDTSKSTTSQRLRTLQPTHRPIVPPKSARIWKEERNFLCWFFGLSQYTSGQKDQTCGKIFRHAIQGKPKHEIDIEDIRNLDRALNWFSLRGESRRQCKHVSDHKQMNANLNRSRGIHSSSDLDKTDQATQQLYCYVSVV